MDNSGTSTLRQMMNTYFFYLLVTQVPSMSFFQAYHKINEERKKYLTELDEVSLYAFSRFL